MTHKFVGDLTKEMLMQFVRYDADTGAFYRLKRTSRSAPIGLVENKETPSGYISIAIYTKKYLAHRLAWLYMTGSFPETYIDHNNGIRSDNRFANLREVTNSENQQNIITPRGKNKLLGVYFHKRHNLFSSQIVKNGKRTCLGYFKNANDASEAYWAAKKDLHTVAHERMRRLGLKAKDRE